MRLALCTFCLIFLQIAYSSDTYLKVTNYDEYSDHPSLEHTQDEDPLAHYKRKFGKLHSMKDSFAPFRNSVDRDEPSTTTDEKPAIRHKKHSINYRRHHSYGLDGNYVKITKELDSKKTEFTNEKPAITSMDIEQNDAPLPSYSPISQFKFDTLGTEEKVNERFQSTFNTLPASIKYPESIKKAANDHYEEMKKRTMCKLPIPKIVKIEDVYPNVMKIYYPPCTIIHQCSEESGCCTAKRSKCAPSEHQNITLYFKVTTVTPPMKTTYEALHFINHTECKCLLPEPDRTTRDTLGFFQRYPMESAPKSQNLSLQKRCPRPCPFPFSHRYMADGSCICECYDQHRDCLKYKRGEMYFSFKDNHCLFTNECIYPSCSFGNYLARVGRCPKQYELRDSH